MFTVYPAFLLEGFESSIVLVMSSPRVHWKRIVDWRERKGQGGRERGERERERVSEREVVRIGEGGPERGTKEGRGGEEEGTKKGELFTGEK